LDVVEAMTRITLQIMGSAGFGVDLGAMNESVSFDSTKYTMPLKDAITIASGEAVIARFQFPAWMLNLPLSRFNRIRNAIQDTDKYLSELIQDRLSSSEQKYDLLSLLLAARSEEEKSGLSPMEVKSDSYIFLFAGHETTASQLMWTLYLLATHPEIQEKLYQEVNHVCGDREQLDFEDYEKLKYALCVIRESMRVHPPVASVLKEAEKEDVVGGYTIPAKSMLTIQFYSVHHDPRYWSEPEKFIPERFNEENIDKIPPMAYLPFSIGPRKCIGFMFSLTESVFILSHIVRNFKVGLIDAHKNGFVPQPEQGITIKPKELTLKFTKRQ
jgi:cytochrome P450